MEIKTNPQKRLVIWNKLTDLKASLNPPIGGQWVETGTTSYGEGEFDTCLSNDGSANNIERTDKFTDTGFILERGTIDLYAKWNAFTGGTYVIDLAIDTQTNFLLSIFMQADGKILFSVGKSGDSTSALSSVLSTGQFYHIVCQWDKDGIDGGSNILRINIDESLDGTSDTAILIDNTSASESFHIGSSRLNADEIDGFIDNLKCYNFINDDAITNTTEGDRNITGTNIQINKDELLLLDNRLGSESEVNKSVIGVNGVTAGTPSFTSTIFGTGIDVDAATKLADFLKCPELKGTIEGYWKPHYDSSSTATAYIIGSPSYSAGRIGFRYNSSTELLFFIGAGGGAALLFTSGHSHSIDDEIHLAIVWDENGIDGGSDTMRIYTDGDLSASTTTAIPSIDQTGIRTGNHRDNLSFNFNANAVLSNFKYSNYAKTDFSDRLFPGIDRVSEFRFDPNKTLQLWNKLNDGSGQSIVGPDSTVNGSPSFVACKYKQGPDIDANTKYVDISKVPGQKGTVEIWIKPHFSQAGGTDAYFIDASSTGVRVSLLFDSSENDFSFGLFEGGTGYVVTSAGVTFAIDEVIHIAGVWDTDGIQGGNDRTQLYINKLLVASSTGAIATITQTGVRIGNRNALDLDADSVIEDYKLSNYAITEFKDSEQQELMNVERLPSYYLQGIY